MFAALSPKWRGGRARKVGPAARDQICRIAACKPAEPGLPFTAWSLTKLVGYLAEHLVGLVVDFDRELRQVEQAVKQVGQGVQ